MHGTIMTATLILSDNKDSIELAEVGLLSHWPQVENKIDFFNRGTFQENVCIDQFFHREYLATSPTSFFHARRFVLLDRGANAIPCGHDRDLFKSLIYISSIYNSPT